MYIKIQHIYTTIIRRNVYVYISTISLSYTTLAVYESAKFGFMLY